MILRHAMVWKAVGAESPEDILENYDKYRELSREFSPYLHVDKNDPPAFLFNRNSTVVPAANVSDAIHHPLLSLKLKEKADEVGAECHVFLCGTKKSFYEVSQEFIEDKLLDSGR